MFIFHITKLPSSAILRNGTKYFINTNPMKNVINTSNNVLYKDRINIDFYSSASGSKLKKTEFQIKEVQSSDLIKSVLERNKKILQEKKNVLVKDIKEKKEKVEEVIERENVFTIPNLLCVTRAFMSPYLAFVIIQNDFNFAMCILVVAGFTDLMDGYIARNWPGQASRFGSFLDPMADKLLMGSLVISLTYCNLMPLWLTFMILFRDIFLIGAGFIIRYKSLPPPRTFSRYFDVTHATAQLAPTFISKVNTAIQLVTVATTLGAPIWNYIGSNYIFKYELTRYFMWEYVANNRNDHPYLQCLWYVTGITTAAAALSYITKKDTYKILRKNKNL